MSGPLLEKVLWPDTVSKIWFFKHLFNRTWFCKCLRSITVYNPFTLAHFTLQQVSSTIHPSNFLTSKRLVSKRPSRNALSTGFRPWTSLLLSLPKAGYWRSTWHLGETQFHPWVSFIDSGKLCTSRSWAYLWIWPNVGCGNEPRCICQQKLAVSSFLQLAELFIENRDARKNMTSFLCWKSAVSLPCTCKIDEHVCKESSAHTWANKCCFMLLCWPRGWEALCLLEVLCHHGLICITYI